MLPPVPSTGPSHVGFCARKNSLLCSDKTLLCSHQSRQQVLLMLASVLGKTLYYAQEKPYYAPTSPGNRSLLMLASVLGKLSIMLRKNPIMLPSVPSTGPSHVSFCASLLCSAIMLPPVPSTGPSHVSFCARKNSLLCSGKTLLCSHQSRQQVLLMLASVLGKTQAKPYYAPTSPVNRSFSCWLLC